MRKIDYVVFVHRYYDAGRVKPGGLDYIIEYLINKKKTLLIVETPLFPRLHKEIIVRVVNNNNTESILKFSMPFINDIFTWGTGVLIDIYMALKYGSRHAAVITSDPLTSLPAIILKRLGYFTYHYFHCIDYSDKRFINPFVDWIYKVLRNLSFRLADSVGCVSKAIYSKVTIYKYKAIFYIPNSPSFKSYQKYRVAPLDKNNKELVLTCLGIAKRYKVFETVKLFYEIWKVDKECKLVIIGSTELDTAYYKKVLELINEYGCQDSVIFKGYVSRDENCTTIGKAYLGLCFYDDTDSFAKYADSLKIREYAALGIPCVSDRITSTALEMEENNAGITVENISDAAVPVLELLRNKLNYENLVNGSLVWAEKMDKDRILNDLIYGQIEKQHE